MTSGFIALAAALSFIADGAGFILDDAFIHLAYAKSVWLGEGLSYNPRDWETGTSSLLWPLLLAPLQGLSNPERATQILGAVLHGMLAAFAARIVQRLAARSGDETHGNALALLGGALVGLSPLQLHGATSGMETALAAVLLAVCVDALLAQRRGLLLAAATLSVWSRPELFVVLIVLGTAWRLRTGGAVGWWAVAGALLGQGAASAYYLCVSGYPLPNTYYVKGRAPGLDGMIYFARVVMPREAWMVSATGMALCVRALLRDVRVRRGELTPLAIAAAVGIVATAVSRGFKPGVLFWQWRYFSPMMPLLTLLLPFGLLGLSRLASYLLLTPTALVSCWLIAGSLVEYRGQSEDIAVHVAAARYVATKLPRDAVIGVEAAGAARYFTPRSMRIIDLEGLNNRSVAHVRTVPPRLASTLVAQRPTHLLIPNEWGRSLERIFTMREVVSLQDPEVFGGIRRGMKILTVFEVLGSVRAGAESSTPGVRQVGATSSSAGPDGPVRLHDTR